MGVRVVRLASKSKIKEGGVIDAFALWRPGGAIKPILYPVELQDRSDLEINAQPEGREQTLAYVYARKSAMQAQYGALPPEDGFDVIVESGAIDGEDVAVVLVQTHTGHEAVAFSPGIPFPAGTLEEARRRGFRHTTAGDVIHERHPHIPADDWQHFFEPRMSRRYQIGTAILEALRTLEA